MSDLKLRAKSPLKEFSKEFDGLSLEEITNCALVSIATPKGGEEKLEQAISNAYGVEIPAIGKSADSTHKTGDNAHFLGMQNDQLFVLFDYPVDEPTDHVTQKLGDAGYFTDQSDSWVILKISGQKSREALSRICAIDLETEAFTQGSVARTVMEHLGTIIYRDGEDSFILFSARSSAKSFLHAVETSIQNIS